MNKYISAILTGSLLALAFPPIPTFFLAFIAFVPLLLTLSTENHKKSYFLIYIAFFIYHSGSNWWIGSWTQDSDPYLTASSIVLAFVHPIFFMIPFAFFFKVREKFSVETALVLFPFFWVAFEWFHNLGELSYPWLTVGNTQIYNHYWIQFVDITGVWGASFLVLLTNVVLVQLFLLYKAGKINDLIKTSKGIIRITILLSIIVLPIIYGAFRIQKYDNDILFKENPSIRVGIVQPAINPWRKWEMSVDDLIRIQLDIADSLVNSSHKPDLIIWNETAIPRHINLQDNFGYYFLTNWCRSRNTSLFTGFAELIYYNSKNKTATSRQDTSLIDTFYESYNSSLLINPSDDSKPQVYRKMKLTPMAERLPYSEYLLFMRSWFEWGVGISAWGIGQNQNNLNVISNNDTTSIGPVICIESIYPEFVSKTSTNGSDLIIVITNDAWYDNTPGPEQHYLISAMRAIENRRYVARCANTGVSGVITPTGSTLSRLPQYQKSGLSVSVPKIKDITIYSQLGDWVAELATIITLISLSVLVFKK